MIKYYEKLNQEQSKGLLEIWEQSVKATHNFLDEKNFRTIKEYLQNADFKDLNFLFAYENDEFVGFLGADKECIQMLFVKPEYFRKKIGSNLLQKALDDFKIKKVEVNLDNPNALKFYQEFGFEKVGEYKDDFGFILIKMEIKS